MTIIFSLPTAFVSNLMYTLDLCNNALYIGNVVKIHNWYLPHAILYDPQNGYIYVANLYSGTVSIISTKATSTPLTTSFAIIGTIAVIIVIAVILVEKDIYSSL